MFAPERILDRGRVMLGMLVVVPLGVLGPALGGPPEQTTSPTWSVAATTPNPIAPAPTPRDVLANLTNPTVGAPTTPSTDQVSPSPSQSGSATPAPASAGEVGSESDDPQQDAAALQIPGTSPDAGLVAKLRQSQSRFTPATPTPPTTSPGDGPMPLANPTTGVYPVPQGAGHVFPIVGGASFSNDWGGPRPGGRSHQGIDLFAATGTPIVAISDGTLFKVGWNGVGGWRFWLRDKWGNEFYHAHLSAFAPAAREGATVTAGTVIGFVGNTGDARTTPPHLHFEIHPGGGGPIPPFSYVSAWPRL